ncbi:MAG TPA: hypothetical protein V6D27_00995 [Vampirovibrionales bacterium]
MRSLTSELALRGEFYRAVLEHIDATEAQILMDEHRHRLAKIHLPAIAGTDFALAGMAVIYAVRDFQANRLGIGTWWWEETVASRAMTYPYSIPAPARFVLMALADKEARTGRRPRQGGFWGNLPGDSPLAAILPDYRPTIHDVGLIYDSFAEALPDPQRPFVPNPSWTGVPADANLLMGRTLWDIRTTQSRQPLTLLNLAQQVAYCLINQGEYKIDTLGVYYSRQQAYFEYPLTRLLIPGGPPLPGLTPANQRLL